MQIQPLDDPKAVAVQFEDRLLSGNAAALDAENELALLARFPCRGRLLLDFGGVELASAAVLGRLAALHRAVSDAGGELVLVNVGPSLFEVFRATGLARVLDVRRTA
jgi:anti-anti-sigma factor